MDFGISSFLEPILLRYWGYVCILPQFLKHLYANSEIWSGTGDYAFWGDLFKIPKPRLHPDAAAAAPKSLQSCPTLCDPIDDSPTGSPIPGILQARILEWVAISFSNAWKWKVKVKLLSRVPLFATPWTAAHQAPPSMGFSRQEYWSGVPLPSPRTTIWPSNSTSGYLLNENKNVN